MTTARDIIGQVYSRTRTDGLVAKVPGLEENAMLQELHRINEEFVDRPYNTGGANWSWMRREAGFTIPDITTLVADITTGATSISVANATELDSPGVVVLNDFNGRHDVVTYDSITANVLNSTEGVGFDHLSGTFVQKLFKIDSFRKVRPEVKKDHSQEEFKYCAGKPTSGEYSLWTDENDETYLWLPLNLSGEIQVVYDQEATNLYPDGTTTDFGSREIDAPRRYENFHIHKLNAYVYRTMHTDLDRAAMEDEMAEQVIRNALRRRNNNRRIMSAVITDEKEYFPNYNYF